SLLRCRTNVRRLPVRLSVRLGKCDEKGIHRQDLRTGRAVGGKRVDRGTGHLEGIPGRPFRRLGPGAGGALVGPKNQELTALLQPEAHFFLAVARRAVGLRRSLPYRARSSSFARSSRHRYSRGSFLPARLI